MCNKKCQNLCVLCFNKNNTELMKFKLSKSNLPYKQCQNFPDIIKSFINNVGINTLIGIAKTVPNLITDDKAAVINNAYMNYKTFLYNNNNYNIRFTLTSTDGTIIYDSNSGTTDANAKLMQLHTTRMEFQRASETRWGAQTRNSITVSSLQEYAAIWIPNILMLNYQNDPLTVVMTYGFRFSVQLNPITGNYQPLLLQ